MLSDTEYKQQMRICVTRSGGQFLMVDYKLIRYLDGDGSAACVMAYFLNLLRMKHSNPKDRKLLKRNNMAFRCPVKDARQKMNMGMDRERNATNKLAELGLIEVFHRKGNVRWIRVLADRLKNLKKTGNQETGKPVDRKRETRSLRENGKPVDRKRETRSLRENGKPVDSIDTLRNFSKKQKEECRESEPRDSPPKGFFPKLGKSPTKFDHECARQLYSELAKKDMTVGEPARKVKWADEFRILREKLEGNKDRIEKALDWYLDHLDLVGSLSVPQILSAHAFREKFIQLELAMKREQNDQQEKTRKKEEERDLGW